MREKVANSNLYAFFLVLAQLGLVVLTWHDMAVAQGVGLYLSMEAGADNRLIFDLAADVWCALSFVIAILLPVLVLKLKQPMQVLRFVSAYLAFMPILRPAMLVHLFDGHSLWTIHLDVTIGLNMLFGFLREVVPLLFLLAILCKMSGYVAPKWHVVVWIAEALLCVGMFILPELSEVCRFVMYYLLAVLAFERWEKLLEKKRVFWEKIMVWLVFALLYFRGCEKMLTLMANHHL